MIEEWKKIRDTGYEISNRGRVRGRMVDYIKPITSGRRYAQVCIVDKGKFTFPSIHRLVASYFVKGKTKDKCTVNHKDGNKSNNCASNLEWCTLKENIAHATKNNLLSHGESHVTAKLNIIAVILIKELDREGYSHRDLGKIFGVAYSTIRSSIIGQNWKRYYHER